MASAGQRLTKKVYSIQEGYGEIAEIDPDTLTITKTFDLAGTPYTSYGISPDGKYLLLRGETTAPQATKLGVIDLSATTPAIANLTTPELDTALNGTSPGGIQVFSRFEAILHSSRERSDGAQRRTGYLRLIGRPWLPQHSRY